MLTSTQLTERIRDLHQQSSALYREQHEMFMRLISLKISSQEYEELHGQYVAIGARINAIDTEIRATTKDRDDEWAFEEIAYHRPSTGILGLISKPLGPLPKRVTIVNPSRARIGEVPGQTLKAVGTSLLALGLAVLLAVFIPFTRISPYSIVAAASSAVFGAQNGPYIAIAVCVVLLLALGYGYRLHAYEGTFLNKYAMYEEQWFRMGAENWSGGQRLYSCVAFGFMHVVNVIYPLSSLIVLSVVGGVFLLAYLREYKRTQSAELATLASTRLHATYNRFGLAFLVLSIAITMYSVFIR